MDERIHLHLEGKSGYKILKTLGDLTGFEIRADLWHVELFQAPYLSGRSSSLEPAQQLPQDMIDFLEFKLKRFNCESVSPIDALKQIQTTYEAESKASKPAPPMGIIRYAELTTPKDKPLEPLPNRIHLHLQDVPVREALRYIGELSNCSIRYNHHSIGLYHLVALHHPKPVYRVSMQDITRQYGQPSGNVDEWLLEKFDLDQVSVWSAQYHKNSGDVFIVTEPESLHKLLPKKTLGSQ